MPERAEIAIMADQIGRSINDKICKRVTILPKYSKAFNEGFYSSMRLNYGTQFGTVYVDINIKLLHVTSYGKKIIFIFENGLFFISSCGMTGRWTFKHSKNTCLIFAYKTNL